MNVSWNLFPDEGYVSLRRAPPILHLRLIISTYVYLQTEFQTVYYILVRFKSVQNVQQLQLVLLCTHCIVTIEHYLSLNNWYLCTDNIIYCNHKDILLKFEPPSPMSMKPSSQHASTRMLLNGIYRWMSLHSL